MLGEPRLASPLFTPVPRSVRRGDWLLSFVYRTSSAQLHVAGLQPVLLQDRRVENVDLSSVVSIPCPSEGSLCASGGAAFLQPRDPGLSSFCPGGGRS